MAYKDVRIKLKALLEGVDGIGEVHEYRRNTRFWDEFHKRHIGQLGKVNSWEITRVAISDNLDGFQGAAAVEPTYTDMHEIVVQGNMSVNDEDASELVFQDLLEAIRKQVRDNNELDMVIIIPETIQVPLIEHRTFGGVLCHFAQCTFAARERTGV